MTSDRPLVVVSAGTYHLPFDRLMDWMEPWTLMQTSIDVIAQHGTTRRLERATNYEMLSPRELVDLYRGASVLVLQGGAGGIMDAREAGRIPIVVPRLPEFKEVVDNHQRDFAHQLASKGVIHLATSPRTLHSLLDRAVAGVLTTRTVATPTPGVDRLVEVLADLPTPLTTQQRRRRLTRSFVHLTCAKVSGPARAEGAE